VADTVTVLKRTKNLLSLNHKFQPTIMFSYATKPKKGMDIIIKIFQLFSELPTSSVHKFSIRPHNLQLLTKIFNSINYILL